MYVNIRHGKITTPYLSADANYSNSTGRLDKPSTFLKINSVLSTESCAESSIFWSTSEPRYALQHVCICYIVDRSVLEIMCFDKLDLNGTLLFVRYFRLQSLEHLLKYSKIVSYLSKFGRKNAVERMIMYEFCLCYLLLGFGSVGA